MASNIAHQLPPHSLRFERRKGQRVPNRGFAMAAFWDDEGAITLTRVELTDASAGGLGLTSPVHLRPGARFSLYTGSLALAHRTGSVARCEPAGDAYRVGLRCDSKLAA